MIDVKIKKLDPKAVIPFAATEHSAGLDLTAVKVGFSHSEDGVPVLVYDTQIAIEIPEGHVGLLFPRSSLANKSLNMTNCVGVIDSDYRGEVGVIAYYYGVGNKIINKGTRIAQLVITPCERMEIEYTDTLSNTERGRNGFGSTGK